MPGAHSTVCLQSSCADPASNKSGQEFDRERQVSGRGASQDTVERLGHDLAGAAVSALAVGVACSTPDTQQSGSVKVFSLEK
jgi:hypothetical protein